MDQNETAKGSPTPEPEKKKPKAAVPRRRPPKKHKWDKTGVYLLGAAAAVILLIAVLMITQGRRSGAPLQETTAPPAPGSTSTFRLAAVGDITVDNEVLSGAMANSAIANSATAKSAVTNAQYDFTGYFFPTAEDLSDADLTLATLDGIVNGLPYSEDTRSAPEDLLKAMAGAGIDLVQTASSYAIQSGIAGLRSTVDAVERNGMTPLGTFRDKAAYQDAGGCTVREVNGIKVAFVSFTKGLNNMSLPEGSEYAVNLLYQDYDTNYTKIDTDGILAVLQQAKAQSPDVIIATLHWGSENEAAASASQEKLADLLFANGVDAIIGSHSHLVGKMEQRTVTVDGKEKNVFISYSLGNFLTRPEKNANRLSCVLHLEFTKNRETGTTTLSDVYYTPVYLAGGTGEAQSPLQVLNSRNAVALYDAQYVNAVDKTLYEAIQDSFDQLKTRTESEYGR